MQLQVRNVSLQGQYVHVTFLNAGARSSPAFVPLLVVTDAAGHELQEVNGAPLRLTGGESRTVRLLLPENVLRSERYLAVLPADPNSGKRVGAGFFHLSLEQR